MNAFKSLLSNVVGVNRHKSEVIQNQNFPRDHSNPNITNAADNNHGSSHLNTMKCIEEKSSVNDEECKEMQEMIFDLIKDIVDPEKPQTLEELEVVREDDVFVYRQSDEMWIRLEFTPTVPHCSLASLIGLCIRRKLETCLPDKHKLDIYIKEGTHSTAEEINKQINDKERIAAAMENPNLQELVNKCIRDEG